MEDTGIQVLVVDQNSKDVASIRDAFNFQEDFTTLQVVSTLAEAREQLAASPPHLVITELELGDGLGWELLPTSKHDSRCPVVILSRSWDQKTSDEVIHAGAMDFVKKTEASINALPKIVKRVLRVWDLLQEWKHMGDEMKQGIDDLQKKNEELRDFATFASHDLNEPLRKIISFGDRLRHSLSEENEQVLTYVERMQKASGRMQTLINNLLDFAGIDTEVDPFEPTDLGQIVSEVLDDLESIWIDSRSRVEVGPLPEISAVPFQMKQLFQNLISNAIKYHREGQPPVVLVNSRRTEDGQWEIRVEDNGIGIDPRHGERIFRPFQRLHARSKYEGSGMGLTICKKIVERHGGTLTVTSEPMKGSTFIVRLPILNKQ